ncbi:MAG: GGDEF domain-containing protein [Nanoarchaeota archaeon]
MTIDEAVRARIQSGYVTCQAAKCDLRTLSDPWDRVAYCNSLLSIAGLELEHVDSFADAQTVRFLQKYRNVAGVGLRNQSRTDKMTGIGNTDALEIRLTRTQNPPSTYAICQVDIDHFKSINDTYGHEKGDRAIRQVVRLMQEAVRGTERDIKRSNEFFRNYNGDEFVIFLNRIEEKDALAVGQRIVDYVSDNSEGIVREGENITISMGIAIAQQGQPPQEMMQCADQALYQAKEQGRDRVIMYQE